MKIYSKINEIPERTVDIDLTEGCIEGYSFPMLPALDKWGGIFLFSRRAGGGSTPPACWTLSWKIIFI